MAQSTVDGHEDALTCNSEGTWKHVPGTEWLAADLSIIPRLQALLHECTFPLNESQVSLVPGESIPDRTSPT